MLKDLREMLPDFKRYSVGNRRIFGDYQRGLTTISIVTAPTASQPTHKASISSVAATTTSQLTCKAATSAAATAPTTFSRPLYKVATSTAVVATTSTAVVATTSTPRASSSQV
ncbi:hypothetical protein ACLOJK_019682, partial [Asimina triloba]